MSKKAIKGFPGYKIDASGNVYNKQGRKLSPRPDDDGYKRVDLRKNGKRYTRFVHSLNASGNQGNTSNEAGGSRSTVHHKDGNRKNNSRSNLKRMSQRSNVKKIDRS